MTVEQKQGNITVTETEEQFRARVKRFYADLRGVIEWPYVDDRDELEDDELKQKRKGE